jgi:hypothetical protein
MDPELLQKHLEGQENVIAPAVEKEQSFLKAVACPGCSGYSTEARVNAKRPFIPGLVLANKILHCLECGVEFDPHSRIISKTTASSG